MSTFREFVDEADIVPPSKRSLLEIERALNNGDTDALFEHIGKWLSKNRRHMQNHTMDEWCSKGLVNWSWNNTGRSHVPDDIFYTLGTHDTALLVVQRYKQLAAAMEILALFREKANVQIVLDRWEKLPPKKFYTHSRLGAMSKSRLLDHVEPLIVFTEHFLSLCAQLIPKGDKTEGRYHRLSGQRAYLVDTRAAYVEEDYDEYETFTGKAYD